MNTLSKITGDKKDLEDIKQRIIEDGIVIIPGFLGQRELKEINLEFENILENNLPGVQKLVYDTGRAARIILKKLKGAPTTKQIFMSDFMNRISKKYFGSTKFNLNEEIFVVNDVKGQKHIAQDLHYDRIQTLKFFMYLNDTSSKNGAFTACPGSHKLTQKLEAQNRLKNKDPGLDKTRELPEEIAKQAMSIDGKAGTLIIFDTDVFHKAGTVSEGQRLVMRGHTRRKKNLFERVKKKLMKNE